MRRLQGPPANPLDGRPNAATSGPDGRFTFTGIDPGSYSVTVDKAGFAPVSPGPGRPPTSVDLTAGARRDDIVVTLQRGGVIAGRVVDATGEPISGVRVMALRPRPTPPRPLPNGVAIPRLLPSGPSAQTDDLGEFRLFSLAPGDYYVQVMPAFSGPYSSGASSGAPVNVPTFYPGTIDDAAAQAIAVSSGQTVRDVIVQMRTASAFRISGIVVDDSGQPFANVMIQLRPAGAIAGLPSSPPAQGRTDAQGRFTLAGVTNGAYTLVAAPPRVLTSGQASGGFSGITTSGAGSFVSTETRNGTTTQYQEADGTKVPVTVNEGDLNGIQIPVHRVSTP